MPGALESGLIKRHYVRTSIAFLCSWLSIIMEIKLIYFALLQLKIQFGGS